MRALRAATAKRTVLLVACATAADPGPTYGSDYSGGDYNVTRWSSDPSLAPGHWRAAALECEALCVADPRCCTWTYCTPEGGDADPERCCLKDSVPAEIPAATHWTGAPRGNTTACLHPPPPPYPGPPFQRPRVTNAAPCLQTANWHDVAGALVSDDGSWHVFQGSGACGGVPAGWHHAVSRNGVDWANLGVEPTLAALAEPYGTSSPCSGFLVRDDDGVPCAGFRQCAGNWPGRVNTQVPLELRCATSPGAATRLDNFSAPEYLFWFAFNRNLPYDPVRPWVDADGAWYATIAADACNATALPCAGGGALYLFTSPALRGPAAAWRPAGVLFASNWTVLTPHDPTAVVTAEFVTPDYVGALPGDPRGGATRCVTNNVFDAGLGGTTAYFCGTQRPGGPLVVDSGGRGMLDWGAFARAGNGAAGVAALVGAGGGPYKMARTLSPSSANQVTAAGRKVLTAWLDLGARGGGGGQAAALPRDLSLDAGTGELLQAFAPELQALRVGSGNPVGLRAQQLEVVADFAVAAGADAQAEFGVDVLLSEDGADAARVRVLLGAQLVAAGAAAAGPLLPPPAPGAPLAVHMHAIVDHSILTVIVNNRTAVTAWVGPRDADSTRIALAGVDGMTVTCSWRAWALRDANITAQPMEPPHARTLVR